MNSFAVAVLVTIVSAVSAGNLGYAGLGYGGLGYGSLGYGGLGYGSLGYGGLGYGRQLGYAGAYAVPAYHGYGAIAKVASPVYSTPLIAKAYPAAPIAAYNTPLSYGYNAAYGHGFGYNGGFAHAHY